MAKNIGNMAKKLKIVEWPLADKCNYHCSYCTTIPWSHFYPPLRNYRRFLDKLHHFLKGGWLINLGGFGEPFTQPDFLSIVKELAVLNYCIGVTTNFSYPVKEILKFYESVDGRLSHFNASLHLEFVDVGLFLKKALKIHKIIGPRFVVSAVARRGMLPRLLRIGQYFEERGIRFVLQAEKVENNYREYTKKEIVEIAKKFKFIYPLVFKGKKCSSGADYLFLENNGEVYSCHRGWMACKYAGNKNGNHGCLGNILKETFRFRKGPFICESESCVSFTRWRTKNPLLKSN